MEQVEKRLGKKPQFGALDAGFDAFYTYEYFHNQEPKGIAAIPLSTKNGKPTRQFDEEGLPICAAGLTMPLKFTFMDRTTNIIPHEKGHHVCPLLYPEANGRTCPIAYKRWSKEGCTTQAWLAIQAAKQCFSILWRIFLGAT